MTSLTPACQNTISLKTVSGPDLLPYIEQIAQLRIQIFRAFPYLYEGSLAYEQKYLQRYLDASHAAAILAFDGEQLVGASTCLPMSQEDEAFKQPFIESGYPIERLFYFAESVLDARFRGQGIGQRFFTEREKFMRSVGNFQWATFCAVDRGINHPQQPQNYRPLDPLWHKNGFVKTHLTTHYAWQDIGESNETSKPMIFWIKEFPKSASVFID
ncbi:GNAT family N-acetyltransferase [Marinomonas sp. THO17]|uniref:GNAT family N-acetyltransferase n=1 Tax=Marinomonas sp. THO17 TaxID=3149048 RepID=UPI00336BED08